MHMLETIVSFTIDYYGPINTKFSFCVLIKLIVFYIYTCVCEYEWGNAFEENKTKNKRRLITIQTQNVHSSFVSNSLRNDPYSS